MTNTRYTPLELDPALPRYPRYGGLLWGVSWPANPTYSASDRLLTTHKLMNEFAKKDLAVFEEPNSTWVYNTPSLNTDSSTDGRFSSELIVRTDAERDMVTAMAMARTSRTINAAVSYNAANQPWVLAGARRSDLYTEFLTLANTNDWWINFASTHLNATLGSGNSQRKYADFSHPNCLQAYVDLVIKYQRRTGFRYQFFDELQNYPFQTSNLELYNGSTSSRTRSGIDLSVGGTWQAVMQSFLARYKAGGGLPCIVNGEQPSTTTGPAQGRMWQKWWHPGTTSPDISTMITLASAFWGASDIYTRLCMAQSQWINTATDPDHAPPQFVNQYNGTDIFSREDLAAGDRADTVNNGGRNQNLNYNGNDSWNGSVWSGSDPTWTTGKDAEFIKLCKFNAGVNTLIDGISNVDSDAPFAWPWQYTPWEPGVFGVPLEYTPTYDENTPRLRKISNGDRYVWVRYFTNGVLVVNESSATFTDDGTVLLGRSLGTTIVSLAARTTIVTSSAMPVGDAAFFPTKLLRFPPV